MSDTPTSDFTWTPETVELTMRIRAAGLEGDPEATLELADRVAAGGYHDPNFATRIRHSYATGDTVETLLLVLELLGHDFEAQAHALRKTLDTYAHPRYHVNYDEGDPTDAATREFRLELIRDLINVARDPWSEHICFGRSIDYLPAATLRQMWEAIATISGVRNPLLDAGVKYADDIDPFSCSC